MPKSLLRPVHGAKATSADPEGTTAGKRIVQAIMVFLPRMGRVVLRPLQMLPQLPYEGLGTSQQTGMSCYGLQGHTNSTWRILWWGRRGARRPY